MTTDLRNNSEIAKTMTALRTELASVNGRRSTRILCDEDVLQAVAEAQRTRQGHRTGGTVANSYGYQAVRTVCFTARRTDGGVTVAIGLADAKKTTAGIPTCVPFDGNTLRRRDWPSLRLAWADEAPPPSIIIQARQVLEMLVARRRAARTNAHAMILHDLTQYTISPADIMVTTADSLAAGNCPAETLRVAKWFQNRESVNASELLSKIERREPTLARYALAAVQIAARRRG